MKDLKINKKFIYELGGISLIFAIGSAFCFLLFYLYESAKLSYFNIPIYWIDIFNNWSIYFIINIVIVIGLIICAYYIIYSNKVKSLYVVIGKKDTDENHKNINDFQEMISIIIALLFLFLLSYIFINNGKLSFSFEYFSIFANYVLGLLILMWIFKKYLIRMIKDTYLQIKNTIFEREILRKEKIGFSIYAIIALFVLIIFYAYVTGWVSAQSNSHYYIANNTAIILYRTSNYYIIADYELKDETIYINTNTQRYIDISEVNGIKETNMYEIVVR